MHEELLNRITKSVSLKEKASEVIAVDDDGTGRLDSRMASTLDPDRTEEALRTSGPVTH